MGKTYFKKKRSVLVVGGSQRKQLSANELKDVIDKLIVKNKETVDAFCHTMR